MKEFDDDSRFQATPLMIKSPFIHNFIHQLDEEMVMMQRMIEVQADELKELKDKEMKELQAKLKAQDENMAQTLKACINVPSISSLGTVGATVIARIRDMKDIDQVKMYISSICEKNKGEMAKLRKSVKASAKQMKGKMVK